MGSAAIAAGSAVGAFVTSGGCYCLKEKTKWEHSHFRCDVSDQNCNCGFVHEETELKSKLSEMEAKLRQESMEAQDLLQRQSEFEREKAEQLFQKDLQLADKQNQLAISELERDLEQKKYQIEHLKQSVEAIKDDYLKFRENLNTQLFQQLMSQQQAPNRQEMISILPS